MPDAPGGRPVPLVAVLGGGQLGRMLALAGIPLGLDFRFLDPAPDAAAGAVGRLVTGALDDETALARVTDGADVVTYEWEGVPAAGARFVAARGKPVLPPPVALDVAQDRLREKELCRRLGIGTPAFAAVDDRADLERAVKELGTPSVLKTRRGGYDGKGQTVLQEPHDAGAAWSELGGVPLILEAYVPFDRELSVLAVRGRDGATACWPLVENHHAGGILRRSLAPAPEVPARTQRAGEDVAGKLLDELEYVGVLAVELFDVGGELLVNELAPRVHNSGHWTIEGAVTSQFENHLRAILGWPLGSTAALGVSAMVNCIGALPDPADVLSIPGAHFHRYGKAPRPGRKVGHVTITAGDAGELRARVARVAGLTGVDVPE
ncbi:MAG TPA: 5-(carboxyamino)imidazole ribonucleotide synthase [Acidimicrobiia bacterium]|nr:5-(carboxyamino)imidazole ribonucleotide synthase [Acidimicrobiia bacterium]